MGQDLGMAFTPHIESITETDEELAAILADPAADLPPILPTLASILGDQSFLDPTLRPDPNAFMEEQGGWTPEQQDRCREIALEGLKRLRDNGPADHTLSEEEQHDIMCWTTGADLEGPYVSMLSEELAPGNADLRATQWRKEDVAGDRDFAVAVIGAGMSGILAAYRF